MNLKAARIGTGHGWDVEITKTETGVQISTMMDGEPLGTSIEFKAGDDICHEHPNMAAVYRLVFGTDHRSGSPRPAATNSELYDLRQLIVQIAAW